MVMMKCAIPRQTTVKFVSRSVVTAFLSKLVFTLTLEGIVKIQTFSTNFWLTSALLLTIVEQVLFPMSVRNALTTLLSKEILLSV